MYKWLAIVIISVFVVGCNFEEVEPEVLISEVDGAEYVADMEGEMSAKKATHLILQGKSTDITYTFKRAISDSLISQDSSWRLKYFEALNAIVLELDSLDLEYVGTNTFSYFLHYPKEFLNQLDNISFEKTEIWLKVLSEEYSVRTAPNDITINSVINLAHKYCVECTDEQKELVIGFVEMLSIYDEYSKL